MPYHVTLANVWESSEDGYVTARVAHQGSWKKPTCIYVLDDGVWKTDGFIKPSGLVGLSLVASPSLEVASIKVVGTFPAVTSAATSVEFDVYSYDAAGSTGSKTLVQTKSVAIPPEGAASTIETTISGLASTTKHSVEAFVVNNGIRSEPSPVLKVKTGTAATYTYTPNYGWGAQTGWITPTEAGFTISSNLPQLEGHLISHAESKWGINYYAAVGNWATDPATSNILGTPVSPPEIIGHMDGNWATMPYYRLTLGGPSTALRRIDSIYVGHRALVGVPSPNPFGVILRGRQWWGLRASGSGVLPATYNSTVMTGTSSDHISSAQVLMGGSYWGSPVSSTIHKSDLGFTFSQGQYLDIGSILSPVVTFYSGNWWAMMTASHMQLNTRNWEILSWNTIEDTPKVQPSLW